MSKRKMYYMLPLLIVGCDFALNDDSTPEKATKILKSHFKENRYNFKNIVTIINKNPLITLEDAKCLSYEEKTPAVEKLCELQEQSKIFLWSKQNGDLIFYTFESRNSQYWNGYRYIYNSKSKPAFLPLCTEKVLENKKDKDACLHQLDDNWYLEHQYYRLKVLTDSAN